MYVELDQATSSGRSSVGEFFQFLNIEIGAFHDEGHKAIRACLRRAEPKRPPHKRLPTFFLLCLPTIPNSTGLSTFTRPHFNADRCTRLTEQVQHHSQRPFQAGFTGEKIHEALDGYMKQQCYAWIIKYIRNCRESADSSS